MNLVLVKSGQYLVVFLFGENLRIKPLLHELPLLNLREIAKQNSLLDAVEDCQHLNFVR